MVRKDVFKRQEMRIPNLSKILLQLTAAALPLVVSCGKDTQVKLPSAISDGMVLQMDSPAKVWGWAQPGSSVKVKWQGKTVTAKAGEDSLFVAVLPSSPSGGPFTMTIGDKTVSDILVGEVFLCSGQSNMELPVRRCLDAVADDIKGFSDDNIRYFGVKRQYDFDGPMKELDGKWEKASSEQAIQEWGAVAFFTAKALHEKTGVPVGMINSAVGGSPIEAWMGEEILPDYALKELAECRDKHWMDSVLHHNATLYSDWQNRHNALPENKAAKWSKVNIFDTSWAKDRKGENVYGSHLLRKTVRLSADQAKGTAILHLGAMVDADSTFINGKYVGNTTYMYPPRNYSVPEGVLKEGDNLIEIHLYACGGNPASFVRDKEYSLETPAGTVSLLQGWEHKDGKRMPARPGEIFLHYKASGLYNGMIAPLKNYTIGGAMWYQGESNTWNAADYGNLLTSMIGQWRETFSSPDLPFYIIELAAFEHSELTDNDYGWNRVQKEQRRTAEKVEGAYVVPNADLGEWNDIHPQDKKTVGERAVKVILDSRK